MIKLADNFVLWILLMLTLPEESYCIEKQYQLKVQPVYVAFSGDLVVNYSIPSDISLPNAFIRLLAEDQNGAKKEISTMGMHRGLSSSSVKFTCGVIEFSALHILEMHMYEGGEILTTTAFEVKWPKFEMELPETHYAQTQPVLLSIKAEAKCESLLRKYVFYIDLEYISKSQEDSHFYTETPTVIQNDSISEISLQRNKIEYQCNIFDLQGSYQSVLRNTRNPNVIISKSNIMYVVWSKLYSVNLISKQSIYPCKGHVAVYYDQPQCSEDKDKIRMYMLRRKVTGSLAAPLERIYITELTAKKAKNFAVFQCNLFTAMATGYCFVYVSVSSSGVVTEQREVCKPALNGTVLPIDGGWSAWSLWGECSITCGTGQRSRFRMCNNPFPADGGRFCAGDPFEWQPCYTPCPDDLPRTPLHSPKIDENCACGCTIHISNSSGEIIGTGRCNGISLWLLQADKHKDIKLQFTFFSLMKNKQWIKIRNGDSSKADLLAVSDGSTLLKEVVSTSSVMLIEFMSKSDISDGYDVTSASTSSETSTSKYSHQPLHEIHIHGFIVVYSARDKKNVTSFLSTVPLKAETPRTMWESTVTIVGIVLCVVIVLVVAIVALYHRIFHKRKHKYAMATQDESPTHMAKSTSMNSTPSHHSNISAGIEIDYDMERPLTRQSKKKDNGTGTGAYSSRKSSVSSNRSKSSNKIRFKTKADIEPGGSPKPSSRQYTPLSSPCVHNDVIEEMTREDKTSLFSTSPLISRKPRSPKIHPSPRIKRTSDSRTPDTPVETKHDMLRRKRKQSESKADDKTPVNKPNDVRIVTGAAVVCTVEEKPRLLSTPDTPCSVTPTGKVNPSEFVHSPTKKDKTKKDTDVKTDNENRGAKIKDKMDIQLNSLEKSDTDTIRKAGSGASDESSSPDKTDKGNQQTTSFIRQPSNDAKPRRPTSLHESYTKSPSLPSIGAENSGSLDNVNKSYVPKFDRTKVLPKPDGQSPKSPRHSKSSTPKSVHSSKSKLTLSPARSIHTPSDIASENLELEYDDYIDYDDPLSYFEPEELERMKWQGAEKIGKHQKADDD